MFYLLKGNFIISRLFQLLYAISFFLLLAFFLMTTVVQEMRMGCMLFLSLRPSSMRFEPAAPLMRPMFFTQAIGDRIDGVALYTQASVDNDTFDCSSVRVH